MKEGKECPLFRRP